MGSRRAVSRACSLQGRPGGQGQKHVRIMIHIASFTAKLGFDQNPLGGGGWGLMGLCFDLGKVSPGCDEKCNSLLFQRDKCEKRQEDQVWRTTYRRALISLGSKVRAASEGSPSSAPLPFFLSFFSSRRYIFIICFSCSDWMVTWQP